MPEGPVYILPPRHDFFTGRHRICGEIMALLLVESGSVVVLGGVGGIGKTTIAIEIAYLCRSHGSFDAIIWLTIAEAQLRFGGETYEWGGWLRHLNGLLGWSIPEPTQDDDADVAFEASCLACLRSGHYLLCVDGISELAVDSALRQFLDGLASSPCRALVTTNGDLDSSDQHWIDVPPLSEAESRFWLRSAGLHWNIPDLHQADDQQLSDLLQTANGIPLALLWCVAQLDTHTPTYDDRLRALSSTTYEQLLTMIFQASFERLDDEARNLLLALAVFPESASAEAWARVADVPETSLARSIAKLRWLVVIQHPSPTQLDSYPSDQSQSRYMLLEIARTFGLWQLRQDPALDTRLRINHINYYQEFCQKYGGISRRTYDRIAKEWPHIWQAIDEASLRYHATAGGSQLTDEMATWGRALISFANTLNPFCRVRSLKVERLKLCEEAARAAERMGNADNLGRLTYIVGWIYCSSGAYLQAKGWAEWALKRLTRLGSNSGYALRLLARIERDQARDLNQDHQSYSAIREYLDQARQMFVDESNGPGVARVDSDLGRLAYICKHYQEAEEHHQRALAAFRHAAEEEGEAATLINLGDVYFAKGNYAQARAAYEQALKLAREAMFMELAGEAETGVAEAMLSDPVPTEGFQRMTYLLATRDFAQSAFDVATQYGPSPSADKAAEQLKRIALELAAVVAVAANTDALGPKLPESEATNDSRPPAEVTDPAPQPPLLVEDGTGSSQPVQKVYNIANIKTILTKGFNHDELLNDLCFEVPELNPILDDTSRMTTAELVRKIVERAAQQLVLEKVLRWAEQNNPIRYKQHGPYET